MSCRSVFCPSVRLSVCPSVHHTLDPLHDLQTLLKAHGAFLNCIAKFCGLSFFHFSPYKDMTKKRRKRWSMELEERMGKCTSKLNRNDASIRSSATGIRRVLQWESVPLIHNHLFLRGRKLLIDIWKYAAV